jgi:hypothetical protein
MGVVGGEPVSEERRKEHRPGLPPRAGPAAAGSCTLLLLPSQCLLLPDDNKVTEIKSNKKTPVTIIDGPRLCVYLY